MLSVKCLDANRFSKWKRRASLLTLSSKFLHNGCPLSTHDLRDMIQLFFDCLNDARQADFPFRNNHPGPAFAKVFLCHHPQLRLRKRASLECQRKQAMTPAKLACFYSRVWCMWVVVSCWKRCKRICDQTYRFYMSLGWEICKRCAFTLSRFIWGICAKSECTAVS